MKKKFLALVLTLAMVLSLVPVTALATEGVTEETQADTQVEQEGEGNPSTNPDASKTAVVPEAGKAAIGQTIYNTVKEAVEVAESGATIILGEGNYTLYEKPSDKKTSDKITKEKDLTFIGQGAGKTWWNIGAEVPDPTHFGTEYNGDYSFDGAGTVTFQNMTLRSGAADYLGFIRADKTVVENCTINGKTFYWGYQSAMFKDCTFNCPKGDYALWTYSSPVMTFDGCTFNASGKVVNVYTDYGAGKHDITVNYKDCTVNASYSIKPVLNVNDSNMGEYKYIINISGNNIVNIVNGIGVDKITCSRLFGFGGKPGNNTGRLDVNFGGTAVWRDGKMVNEKTYHNEGVTVDGVSYNNGVDGANGSLYAEGYKDNAFTTTYGSWKWDQDANKLARTVTKTCQYCEYKENTTETKDLELDVSRSKTATELDSNRKSTVKLSLPSAEEALASDIVFVIDKSQCGKAAADAAQQLVASLLQRQEVTKAKVKVGIVIFGGTAIVSRKLSEVTKAEELQSAMAEAAKTGLHGSNVQSGLIEADKMLSKDTEVANSRKYVVLISDGHTYQFSKEGEYEAYTEKGKSFTALKTYGIYNENDLYAYSKGISYTIHSMHDQYYTGDYNDDGTYKGDWHGSYLTDAQYKTGTPGDSDEVNNHFEMPYGTWSEYWKHITSVVEKDNGKYDVLLTHTTGDYDNQCIGNNANTSREERATLADNALGENMYIKCGLDKNGKDNQLMHASGTDRAVYEAYTKYASMSKKYNCYPVFVSKGDEDSANTTQDYGYQLIHAMGEISNNTGTDVGTPNAPVTASNIANIFQSIENDIFYAVGAGSVVEDKMGTDFDFVPGSLKLTVNGRALASKVDGDNGNITYFGAKDATTEIGSGNYRFKVECDSANDKFTWTINENVSNFAPVQLSYQVKLVNANTAAGTYKVLTNEYAKLTPKNSAGQVGKKLEFNNPEVSYTVSGGSGGSHKPTVTIPDDVPTGLNGKDHYAYVVGYPDGMVYPQKNITRAEVATIFFRLLTDETREANMTKSNGYNDMKDGAWYTCAVSTLSKMGIIKGYEDGSFKPDASISRAEFAAIAARFDPDGDTTPATFSDVSSHWAKDEISIAANHGWIKGYEDGSFKPDQKITRAETMTLVNRVLKRLPETKDDLHKDMKTWPDNQNESAWFYLAVQEATNSHYQNLKKDGTHEKWESMRETRDWAALEK